MKRSLPRSLDDVGGMRAARWFRESTAGQWDNFGPDAQREQQDRAIGRYGLVDAGLEWSVASSGWTSAWRTATWEAMVGAAKAGAFDVLVVGYVSRFLRNLKQTLIAVEDHLHAAGVVVLFADERLLSSDPGSWDQFIREAHEAEAYSRKLSKRVGEGYAAKRRRLGVPGGNRAPYGIIREGKPSVLRVDEERAAVVIQAYTLAAAGSTDWEVATQTGLAKTHVGELLTNPIYAGRLRTGEAAGIAPIVDPALWSTVQTMRERRRTRAPGRIVKRAYALRLRCACCSKYLYGDIGRYRHPAPTCEGFLAARPDMRRRRRGCRDEHDRRIQGHSYPQAWYEDAVGTLLGEVGSLDDLTITEAVRLYGEDPGRADEFALARIERQREEAAQRLAKTRDIGTWQATMLRLDAEAEVARSPRDDRRMAPAEVVAYLRSLPAMWADSGPEGRRALATALFATIDVEGYQRMEYTLTPEATELGLSGALPAILEVGAQIGEFGRGERI
ncbi:MAG: recombinase family protein [Microthrixaceae bacterium]|nr:recombinase family protein [Microthrixaceae bacterium]